MVASFAMEKKLDGGAQDPTMLLRVLICAYDRGMMTEKVESKEESWWSSPRSVEYLRVMKSCLSLLNEERSHSQRLSMLYGLCW